MSSIGEALVAATQRLASCSPSARLDAEMLMCRLLGVDRAFLYTHPERALPPQLASAYAAFVSARARGMPVAYLVGEREFFGRSFRVTPDVLVPRPDTELLVDAALQLKLPAHARVLDLGTGSGALAVTLALECCRWQVTAVEKSEAALAVAQDNAVRLRAPVSFLQGDWLAPLPAGARFDLVVCNPPYIDAGDPHLGEGDVRFEPRSALVAGDGGLADIRAVVEGARTVLAPGGWLLLEHGWTQDGDVRALATAAGYAPVKTLSDLGGRPRALLAGWAQPDDPAEQHHG